MLNHSQKFHVVMLDGSELQIQLPKNDLGSVLLDAVAKNLKLVDKEFFGLKYYRKRVSKFHLWLQLHKPINRQLKGENPIFYFSVKFFHPSPEHIPSGLTRYLFYLQCRLLIITGQLLCPQEMYGKFGGLCLLAEACDDSETSPSFEENLVREMIFSPNDNEEIRMESLEVYRHGKQLYESNIVAESHYLKLVEKLSLYGIHTITVSSKSKKTLQIGVSKTGMCELNSTKMTVRYVLWEFIDVLEIFDNQIIVYLISKQKWDEFENRQNHLKLNCIHHVGYVSIRKLYEKYGNKPILCYTSDNFRTAKTFYRLCVDHHEFFCCSRPENNHPPLKRKSFFNSKLLRSFSSGHKKNKFSNLNSSKSSSSIHLTSSCSEFYFLPDFRTFSEMTQIWRSVSSRGHEVPKRSSRILHQDITRMFPSLLVDPSTNPNTLLETDYSVHVMGSNKTMGENITIYYKDLVEMLQNGMAPNRESSLILKPQNNTDFETNNTLETFSNVNSLKLVSPIAQDEFYCNYGSSNSPDSVIFNDSQHISPYTLSSSGVTALSDEYKQMLCELLDLSESSDEDILHLQHIQDMLVKQFGHLDASSDKYPSKSDTIPLEQYSGYPWIEIVSPCLQHEVTGNGGQIYYTQLSDITRKVLSYSDAFQDPSTCPLSLSLQC